MILETTQRTDRKNTAQPTGRLVYSPPRLQDSLNFQD